MQIYEKFKKDTIRNIYDCQLTDCQKLETKKFSKYQFDCDMKNHKKYSILPTIKTEKVPKISV